MCLCLYLKVWFRVFTGMCLGYICMDFVVYDNRIVYEDFFLYGSIDFFFHECLCIRRCFSVCLCALTYMRVCVCLWVFVCICTSVCACLWMCLFVFLRIHRGSGGLHAHKLIVSVNIQSGFISDFLFFLYTQLSYLSFFFPPQAVTYGNLILLSAKRGLT